MALFRQALFRRAQFRQIHRRLLPSSWSPPYTAAAATACPPATPSLPSITTTVAAHQCRRGSPSACTPHRRRPRTRPSVIVCDYNVVCLIAQIAASAFYQAYLVMVHLMRVILYNWACLTITIHQSVIIQRTLPMPKEIYPSYINLQLCAITMVYAS